MQHPHPANLRFVLIKQGLKSSMKSSGNYRKNSKKNPMVLIPEPNVYTDHGLVADSRGNFIDVWEGINIVNQTTTMIAMEITCRCM